MDSTRIHIPNELFTPAQCTHFDGEAALPVVKAGPDSYRFAHPLSWQVDITNTGDALLVCGTVEGEAETSCARCLDDFRFSVEGDIEGYFLLKADSEVPEDLDEDEFDVLPEGGVVDIEPLIVAALLLEFPLVPLCDDHCKGLCPTCGADLNAGPCGCVGNDEEAQRGDVRPSPFAALEGFPFDEGR